MQVTFPQEALFRALKQATSLISAKVVQPILMCVKFDIVERRIIATDLDSFISVYVEKANIIDLGAGAFCLQARKLLEVVSKLSGDITLTIDENSQECEIKAGKSKFKMTSFPADDYPMEPKNLENTFDLFASTARKALHLTAFAAADYDAGSILSTVNVKTDEEGLKTCATDGTRLAFNLEQLLSPLPVDLKINLPHKAAIEAVKALDMVLAEDQEAVATFGLDEKEFSLRTETVFFSTRLMSGDYPRYHELFPNEFNFFVVMDREELLSSLDRVALMSCDRTHLVKLTFKKGELKISANTADVGKADEKLAVDYSGEEFLISINVTRLIDCLRKVSAEKIRLEFLESLKPIILKTEGDSSFKYLLMPVQSK